MSTYNNRTTLFKNVQFVPHREHSAMPLDKSTGYCKNGMEYVITPCRRNLEFYVQWSVHHEYMSITVQQMQLYTVYLYL
jgi:hypothetical protein